MTFLGESFLVWCRLEIESRAWSAPVPFPTLVSPPLSRYMFLRLEFRAIYMPVQWSLEAPVAAHAAVCDSAPVCSIFGPCCRGVGPCTSNVATSHINLIRRNYFLLLNCNRLGNSNSNINSIGNSSSRGSANKRVLPQCINLLARACSQVQPQLLPQLRLRAPTTTTSLSPTPLQSPSISPAPIPINNCVHLSKSCLMFAVWLFVVCSSRGPALFLLAQVSFCFFDPGLLLLHM